MNSVAFLLLCSFVGAIGLFLLLWLLIRLFVGFNVFSFASSVSGILCSRCFALRCASMSQSNWFLIDSCASNLKGESFLDQPRFRKNGYHECSRTENHPIGISRSITTYSKSCTGDLRKMISQEASKNLVTNHIHYFHEVPAEKDLFVWFRESDCWQ